MSSRSMGCEPPHGRPPNRRARWFPGPLVVLAIGIAPALMSGEEAWVPPSVDPHKVVKATRCGRCHESEFKVWKESDHATSANSLAGSSSARDIAARMGITDIRRNSMCLDCHYTPIAAGNSIEAASGVSCESCHGAARDWVDAHYNYGGGGATHKTETPEHRQQRLESTRAAGMFRPSSVYDVVQNCYRCHTVPHESLVNQGEHSSGSDFVLVESFDKIRHNFLEATREENGAAERPLTTAEKRVMWVVGWALDLEYSYRGMANATGDGVFLKAMQSRATAARTRLDEIHQAATIPEVDEMLALAANVPVAAGRAEEHRGNADRLAALNRRFVATNDGSSLTAIDALIEGQGSGGGAEAAAGGGPAGEEASGASGASGGAASGDRAAHVLPAPSHKAIGFDQCFRCHRKEVAAWWERDHHQNAAKTVQSADGLRIAQQYGLKPGEETSPNQICMDCHAGRGAHDPGKGVSCEGCHGPGADYKTDHKKEGGVGLERAGYKLALTEGMNDLKRADPMAAQCNGCHYINQGRLLNAGHDDGGGFQLASSHTKIQHWKHSFATNAELQKAYAAQLKKRGAPPGLALKAGAGGSGSAPEDSADVAAIVPPPSAFTIPPRASLAEALLLIRNRLREIQKAGGNP